MTENDVKTAVKLTKQLQRLNPDAHCTYHHPTGVGEWGYHVHEWGKPISGYHPNKLVALREAISVLKAGSLANVCDGSK
jgi:hypothetical protein